MKWVRAEGFFHHKVINRKLKSLFVYNSANVSGKLEKFVVFLSDCLERIYFVRRFYSKNVCVVIDNHMAYGVRKIVHLKLA